MLNIGSPTCVCQRPDRSRAKLTVAHILGINTTSGFDHTWRFSSFSQPLSFRAAPSLSCLHVLISATCIPRKLKHYNWYSIMCSRENFTNLEITPCVHRCSRKFSAQSLLHRASHKTGQNLFLEQCASQTARMCRKNVQIYTGNILENIVTVSKWQQNRATWMDFANWQNGRLPYDGLHDQSLQVSYGDMSLKPNYTTKVSSSWWCDLKNSNEITDRQNISVPKTSLFPL